MRFEEQMLSALRARTQNRGGWAGSTLSVSTVPWSGMDRAEQKDMQITGTRRQREQTESQSS